MNTIQQASARVASMQRERENYKNVWRDLSKFIQPTRGNFDDPSSAKGRRLNYAAILDSEPMRAVDVLGAGMMSGLTSPAREWFRLGIENKYINRSPRVQQWTDLVKSLTEHVFAKSNVYNTLHSFYQEVAVFGTAAFLVEEDFDNVMRCRFFTVGEYCLSMNAQGKFDTFSREFYLSVKQMAEQFGLENLPKSVQAEHKNQEYENWHKIYHLICPNEKRRPGAKDDKNMLFSSLYWCDASGETFLRESGYDYFPVIAGRWETKTTSDVYGMGAGWKCLGEVKGLQKISKLCIMALEKGVNPPMMVSSNVQGEVNLLPGGLTRYNGTTDPAIKPAYQVAQDISSAMVYADRMKQNIKGHFFADIFLMLANTEYGKMTATEVAERHQEKMLILGPVLERLKNELLDPLIDVAFHLLLKAGVLPPPPEELEGQDLKVEYISIIAQAQKASGTQSIEQLIGFVGSFGQMKPEVLDALNADEIVSSYADKTGVGNLLVGPEEINQIRNMRAKQAQEQQKAAAMQSVLEGAKTTSDIKLGQNSALDAVLGAAQGEIQGE